MEYGWAFGYRRLGSARLQSRLRCGDARAGRVELHSRPRRASAIRAFDRSRRPSTTASMVNLFRARLGDAADQPLRRRSAQTDSLCRARRRAQRRSRAGRRIRAGDQQAAPERAASHRWAAFVLGREPVAVLPGARRAMRGQPAHRIARSDLRRSGAGRDLSRCRRARWCRRCFPKRSG